MNLPNKMTAAEAGKHIKSGIQGGSTRPQALIKAMVTKFGATNLFGKTLKQRSQALRDIAYFDSREDLDKTNFERFGRSCYGIHLVYNCRNFEHISDSVITWLTINTKYNGQ